MKVFDFKFNVKYIEWVRMAKKPEKQYKKTHISFAVPNIGTFYQDTFLVASKADFDRKSVLVRDAENNNVSKINNNNSNISLTSFYSMFFNSSSNFID